MLKSALLVLLSLTVAIGGGALSAWYALADGDTVEIGGWRTAPESASSGSNPYARARLARDGVLAMGQAEGLSLVADRDAGGAPLRRDCRYTIAGGLPAGRLWTLHVAPVSAAGASLNSFGALYRDDGALAVTASPAPAPGNWLPTAGTGPLAFMLTVYDKPIAPADDLPLPTITLEGCDG